MVETGAAAISVDEPTDFAKAIKTAREKAVVIGNVNTNLFFLGSKDIVITQKDIRQIQLAKGAPVTKDVTELFGADGYAKSAGNAVQEAIKMISRLREL